LPRFFFDVREGPRFVSDQEGMEFDTLSAAEYEAATTAAELGRDRLPKGDAREITVEVRNDQHQRMLTVTISMQVHRVTPEPLRNKATEYRDRARSAREVAQWVSNKTDRDQLLRNAERWDAQAEAEEHRTHDQDLSSPRKGDQ